MASGLSFDFWNTLFSPGDESFRHELRIDRMYDEARKLHPVKVEEVRRAFSASTAFFSEEWRIRSRTPTPRERIRLMSGFLEIEFSEEQTAELEEFFGNLIFRVPPEEIPLIRPLLKTLADQYPLGIISDTGYITGKYIRAFLEEKDLLSCFKSLIFSDEEPYSKPHSSLFIKTAEELGTIPGNTVHTGDLEHTDVLGAVSAGFRSIKFTGAGDVFSGQASKADRVIHSYDNFEHILSELLSKDSIPKSGYKCPSAETGTAPNNRAREGIQGNGN
jgi:FMN phosphatase YigB (HAD superfamily)